MNDPLPDRAPLAEIERVLPPTETQRDMWLVDQLSVEGALSYCLSLRIDARGELDRGVLADVLQQLYERHESLRATFSGNGADVRIHRPGAVKLEWFDLEPLDASERANRLEERLQLSVERGFDLVQGPLFRVEVLRLEPRHHVLIFRTHHIICDGWSIGVLMRDFGRLYAAARDGKPPPSPAPSFADFALAHAARARASYAEDRAFWQTAFEAQPAPLDLPPVRARPAVREFASARVDHTLDPDLLRRLSAQARLHGCSLFSIFFAAFNLVLARVCGTRDVVVGVPTAEHVRAGLPDLVGCCVTFVPVNSRVAWEDAFSALIEHTRARFRSAMQHRRLGLAEIVRLLELPRDPSRAPLVNVVLTSLELAPEIVAGDTDLELRAGHIARPFEYFDILANIFTAPGEARIECQYNTTLYDASSVRSWLQTFEAVLERAADDFGIRCSALPSLSPRDRAQLAAWNDTVRETGSRCLVHELIEATARAQSNRTAVVCGSERMTYGALMRETRGLAAHLRGRGLGRGRVVGLLLGRGPRMVTALLATLKVGAAYVPLDPSYPVDRLRYMIESAAMDLLFHDGHTQAIAAELARDGLCIADVAALAADAAAEGDLEIGVAAVPATRPDDPAYVIYTSGSTGRPKGVVVPHRAVVNFLQSMAQEPGLTAEDRLVAVTTLSFDIAVLELLGPLSVGGEVVIATEDEAADPSALRTLVESTVANLMQATPVTWRLLVDAGWRGAPGFRALVGGEALKPDLASDLLERAQVVWNLYGPTEATVWATCWRVEAPEHGIFIGRPVANTTVWVLDENGELCPIGTPGEICIGGTAVATGYLGDPALTQSRFVADPFLPGGRLYRTGDRGRWRRGGMLEYLGRLDAQLKVRGHRIEPGEIEAALSQCPEISTAVVAAHEAGPSDVRLVAYLAARTDFDPAALRARLRGTLPEYMVPQHFVRLTAVPRLPNGKVDRKRLPPPRDLAGAQRAHMPPQSAAERVVARIWSELLGAEVGRTDNFFDSGGHSLLAISAINAIERELGVRLTIAQLIYESLAQIAARADSAAPPLTSPPGRRWLSRLFRRAP